MLRARKIHLIQWTRSTCRRQYKMFLEQSYFKNRRACHSWTIRSNNATKYRRRLDWFLVDKSIHAHTVSCRSHPNPVNSDHRCIIISVNLPRKWFRRATKKPHKPRIPKPNYSLLTSDPDIRLKYQQSLQQQAEQISCFSDNSLNRMHEIISNSLQTAATDTIPTSKAKIESEPWLTDEHISARLQAYIIVKIQRNQASKSYEHYSLIL